MFRPTRLSACLLVGLAALSGGCQQADFGADLTNKTSQVVFARLHIKPNDPSGQAVIAAEKRLGPGDRGFIGPVRTLAFPGVFLTVDTYPNSQSPETMDLQPGTSNLEITQQGDAPNAAIHVNYKR